MPGPENSDCARNEKRDKGAVILPRIARMTNVTCSSCYRSPFGTALSAARARERRCDVATTLLALHGVVVMLF